MKKRFAGKLLVAAALAGGMAVSYNSAQAGEPQTPSATPIPAVAQTQPSAGTARTIKLEANLGGETEPPGPVQVSVGEIIQMAQGGVSKEVLKAYIENSTMLRQPNAADLVAFKQHGIDDDVATAFVKRAGTLEANRKATLGEESGTASSEQAVAAAGNAPADGLDPESYDFWWYNYAYPRTVASANQRILSSLVPYDSFRPFAFGGYGLPSYGFGYGLRPFSSFSYHPRSGFGRHDSGFGFRSPRSLQSSSGHRRYGSGRH